MSGVRVPFFRTPYNYDTEAASDEAASVPEGESLTVQSMSEEADINVLMHRYGISGKLPENPRVPSYGDFSGITDFAGAMDAVVLANEMFMEYPASVRARFENNPQLMLEFVSNAGNREEAQRLGLLKAVAPVVAVPVPPVITPSTVVPPSPAQPGVAPGTK